MSSPYALIAGQWPEFDPRTACFCARRTMEPLIEWVYDNDGQLQRPLGFSPGDAVLLQQLRELAAELELIRDLRADAWWQHATVPMLVEVRRHLLVVVGLMETSAQEPLYTNFVDELTSRGAMDPARLYDPPFSDLAPTGPEGLFTDSDVDNICQLLHLITRHPQAAAAA